jgi:hypothetical protein
MSFIFFFGKMISWIIKSAKIHSNQIKNQRQETIFHFELLTKKKSTLQFTWKKRKILMASIYLYLLTFNQFGVCVCVGRRLI